MSRPISLGYLTPTPDLFRVDPWLITPDGRAALAAPDAIEHWDYSTSLTIERQVSVDLAALRAQCGLGDKGTVRCLIAWRSTKTTLQGSSRPIELVDGPNVLRFVLPGSLAGGSLRLKLAVAAGDRSSTNPLAPKRVGSVLWSDETVVHLEGDQSRLPTEVISFEQLPIAHTDSAWFLDLDTSDLNAPVLGRVKLFINSDHAVHERLSDPGNPPEAIVTSEFLRFDVARQLVAAALAHDELTATEYERGTVGRVLRRHLSSYFGDEGESVEPLRARWRSGPHEVEAELQRFFLK